MLPYITLLGHTLSTYSVLGFLGFLAGLLLVVLACPRFALSRDDGVYLYVFSFGGALLGAKLLSLLPQLPRLVGDLPMLWSGEGERFVQLYLTGGMVYYGGFFGAVVAAWLTARWFSLRLSDFFLVLVPAIPLFHAFGRVGCFCAGCCYGIQAPEPWGIPFTHAIAGPNGVPLLPVQLWESGAELVIFALLMWYACKTKVRGRLLPVYVLLYGPTRFVLEFFRGDPARRLYGPLSTSQWISLAAVAVAAAWLLRRRKVKHEYS